MIFCLKKLGRLLRECNKASPKQKARPRLRGRASWFGVAVTYFRVQMHTIIGANPFHGPVRDGKAWFQIAIAATWTVGRNEKSLRQIGWKKQG